MTKEPGTRINHQVGLLESVRPTMKPETTKFNGPTVETRRKCIFTVCRSNKKVCNLFELIWCNAKLTEWTHNLYKKSFLVKLSLSVLYKHWIVTAAATPAAANITLDTVEKVLLSFPHPELTKILGPPDYEQLNTLNEELCENSAVLPSSVGNGANGYL